jgi:flagella basal body P-ring formation protein FlgA
MHRLLLILVLLPSGALADALVPLRTIRAKEIITADDIGWQASPGDALVQLDDVIGQEARIALYPGRAIRPGDFGPPAIVGRNEIVPLIFRRAGLHIVTEGRALERGAAGDVLRVMNLSSRTTVSGLVQPDGSIEVN